MIISTLVFIDVANALLVAIKKPVQSFLIQIYDHFLVQFRITNIVIVEGLDQTTNYHWGELHLEEFMFIIPHIVVDMNVSKYHVRKAELG